MSLSRLQRWLLIAAVVAAAVLLYRHYELGRWLTLDQLKSSREALVSTYHEHPLATLGSYFAVYVAVAALSIPGAAVLTLAAGALFGLGVGLIVVSFASSLGALLAFWAARYLLRDWVQAKLGKTLAPINAGIAKDGAFYLLTLRLVPAFPFWLVNLLMGLTPISAGRFYIVSQLGMLLGTAVFVNAGTQLAAVRSPGDVLSPGLLGAFVLLGIFPLIAKAVIGWWQRRALYKAWPKPMSYDRNLVVIGAGAGGLVSAYIAATVKAKVTLIEGSKMGGDCLNYGCVPSKALIRSAKLAKQLRNAGELGGKDVTGSVDFAAVMDRVHRVIAEIEPHDSVERYTGLGVEVLQGHARITSPWGVEFTAASGAKQTLTTRNIIIAAGAEPAVPPIPGLKEMGCLTSDTVWGLRQCPKRLLVLGGGPIGCELAQSFARLGAEVTVVEMAPRVMVREDADAAELVAKSLVADGIRLLVGHKALRCETADGVKRFWVAPSNGSPEIAVEFDELLCAVGRSPRVSGYGLQELGIALTPRKTIQTNEYLQTTFPNIYAVGDVAGPYQFTHSSAHQAWYAAVNALFGRFKRFKADYRVLPWATYTDPEVARVGLSEDEAKTQEIAYELTRYELSELDRAIVDGVAHGYVKVLTVPGKDRILGATIVGEHAGELLAEFVLAMKHKLGLNKILGTIHTYPTMAEANKYAAGEWKRAHAPQAALAWSKRLHDWERS